MTRLKQHGDQHERPCEVSHWAYFPDEAAAADFAEWATAQGYQGIAIEPVDDNDTIKVRFNHVGTMALEDIPHHTIAIGRKAEESGGDHDGWKTSVER